MLIENFQGDLTKLALIQTIKNPEDIKEDCEVIGLLSIATYLKKYGDYKDFKIINCGFENPIKEIKKFKPDLIGVSSKSNSYNFAVKLAEDIKERFEVPLILGGVHISTLPSSLSKVFDIAVIGESEQSMLELLQNFEKTGELKNPEINGLVYFENGNLKMTKERELINPLDKIPIPDRTVISKEYYKPQPDWSGERVIKASMETSRGCPYRCRFCAASQFWKTIRFYSPEHVVSDIENLVKNFNVKVIDFIDSTFIINKVRLENILRLMREKDLLGKVKININTRTDTITEENCKLMKEMGIDIINIGFESGNERMIKWLKKETITMEKNKHATDLAVRQGFKVMGSLIFGSPGEKIEDMKQTLEFIDWLYEHGAENIWFFVATPFPGTEFWEIGKEKGIISDDMNMDYLKMVDFNNPILLDKEVDREEFKRIIQIAIEKKIKYFGSKNKMWKSRSFYQNLKSLLSQTETPTSKSRLLYGIVKNILKEKLGFH